MPKIKVKLDLKKDVWNWWEACNKASYGVDWKMKIEPKLREKVVGKKEEQARENLLNYLRNFYEKNNLEQKCSELQEKFKEKQGEIFKTMEKVTMQKIYRDDFICFLTTFPRFPYNYKKGFIWISARKDFDYQVSIFIHELLHFQYFQYYGEKAWDILGPQKYADLKEAMTIILDDEFSHLTSVKDQGYEIHKNLRKSLLKIWRKNKKFDLFFEEAIKMIERGNF